jgi:hypothetical protein
MLSCKMAGRDDIPRGIDFKEMEAALKRAAYKAVHGTGEERSGQFSAEPQRRGAGKGAPRRAQLRSHKPPRDCDNQNRHRDSDDESNRASGG